MANLKESNIKQGMFVPVYLEEQIQEGTFEWVARYIIDHADMSLFEQKYNNDEKGAKAYPPRILLKIIIFCYSRGILSSRKIEKSCKENMVTKALAEGFEPDHDTIAAFISTNEEAVNELFTQVLYTCHKMKLITGEMFAGDGKKLSSNASKESSGKIEELKKRKEKLGNYIKKVVKRHRQLDKDENVKKKQKPFEKTMGKRKDRKKRQLERLISEYERLDKFLETAEPKKGVANTEVKSNITDNESGFIKSSKGYIQGYNGIAMADSGNQIIVAAEVTGSGPESGIFPEMLDKLNENMKKVTGKEQPLKKSLVVLDTGFFTEKNLQEAKARNIEVLIPDPYFRKRDPHFDGRKEHATEKKKFNVDDFTYNDKKDTYICPCGNTLKYIGHVQLRNNKGRKYQVKRGLCANCPELKKCIKVKKSENPVKTLYVTDKGYEENLSEKMRKKIDDPAYRELYSKRQQIIEPSFSDISHCKGMDRFTLRTKKKVGTQWKLYCMVHNIGKCVKPLAEKYGT